MGSIRQIEERRKKILEEMDTIRSMERATLKEQMLPVKHKGKKEPVLRGPYYVLAHWENGKTHSRRVPQEELAQVKQDVANHKHFVALCKEFEDLSQQLGQLERAQEADMEAAKKKPKSSLRRTRK